ncbi:MAG: hypothetical protein R3B13_05905 [Polyangiaceae bacterium]
MRVAVAGVGAGLILLAACAAPTPSAPAATPPAVVREPVTSTNQDATAAPVSPPQCADGEPLSIAFPTWEHDLAAARTAKRQDALLAEVGLDALPPPKSLEARELSRVDVVPLSLQGRGPRDRAVYVVHDDADAEMPADHVRLAILLGYPGDYWCRVRPSLNVDQLQQARACLGVESGTPPLTLRPVQLLAAERDALELTWHHGECGGCGRSGTVEKSLHVERGQTLHEVFRHTVYDASYNGCPFPPVKERVGSVHFEGGFPKTLVVESRTECSAPDPALPLEYREACTPSREVVRQQWNGEGFSPGP